MTYVFAALTFFSAILLPSTGWTAVSDSAKTTPQASATSSPARTLTRVDLKRTAGEATIIMAGDGRLSYRIRSLDTERVIVDLVNVSTQLRHAFQFDDPLVKQIRIGQHPKTLRLVIDVRQPVVYSVQEATRALLVTLSPRTQAKKPGEASPVETISRSEEPHAAGPVEVAMQVKDNPPAPSESNSTAAEAGERHEARKRAANRRVVDQSMAQSLTERYLAVFGGFSMSQSFTDVRGVGDNASVQVSDLALARTGIGGVKLGFSPSTAKWLVMETELFYSSPHIKGQSVTATGNGGSATADLPGSRLRMATWAFNWIVRYPGEWIQPYAGAGLGIFWGRLADPGGLSSADTSPGLNALAGIQAKLGQHLLLFTEYKYNRASFDFSNADLHVLYQAHYLVGGIGFEF